MVKVALSKSFLERRDGRRKFSESLGAGASLAPRLCQRISLGSVYDWKWLFASATADRRARHDSRLIVTSGQDRARTGRSGHATNLRPHLVIRPRRAPEWLRARFFRVVLLANEWEENWRERLLRRPSTPPSNPNTYVKFIFLRTSPLRNLSEKCRNQARFQIHTLSLS